MILKSSFGMAQLSPGPLSTAHADLEGLTNCTKCHDLGKKVSNTKCLDCHSEIQALIGRKEGLHGNSANLKKDCFECHSDHHGRNFEMMRFDEENFDHLITGYELEGQHAKIDCRECHISENIENEEIRKREYTFLGMEKECLSCHNDFHQGTLSSDCISCHNFSEFRPAPGFDHNNAAFQLKGQHASVDCIECHRKEKKNGQEYQEFVGLEFKDCISCHSDPHRNSIPARCTQCHTEQSFSTFTGAFTFDHRSTGFALKGKHQETQCFSCHSKSKDPITIFQDQIGISENNCIACHDDVHENKFGPDCRSCHNEVSFVSLEVPDQFDHNKTDYPLEGKHTDVDCKACHTNRYTEPIQFNACNNCHEDYHKGQFLSLERTPDCKDCHSLTEGFNYTLFSIDEHGESDFPLEGSHIATPCVACHLKEEEWNFRNIGNTCAECHDNNHKDFINEKYYPDKRCENCHLPESWADVSFDHTLTNWPLEGGHSEVQCRVCHYTYDSDGTYIGQTFNGLNKRCEGCHQDSHSGQFEIDGVTNCNRCHSTDNWHPSLFDHNLTKFRLEGKHLEISCSACHLDESEVMVYNINKFECIDCHQ